MIPILIIIPILAIFYALLWSLPYLADRLLSQRIKGFSSTFVYPLAAATLELVNIHVNPVGIDLVAVLLDKGIIDRAGQFVPGSDPACYV